MKDYQYIYSMQIVIERALMHFTPAMQELI